MHGAVGGENGRPFRGPLAGITQAEGPLSGLMFYRVGSSLVRADALRYTLAATEVYAYLVGGRFPVLPEGAGVLMLVPREWGSAMDGSILVAVAGAHDIVDAGLRSLLADVSEVVVMDHFPAFGTIPDVIVYDAIGIEEDGGAEVTALAKESESAVVVMSRDLRPDLATRAMAYGASGYFSIESNRAEVVDMIRAAARGDLESLAWGPADLGAEAGLTRREVDVLCGVVLGMSNHDITKLLALSTNTVKSYIRSAYRKMGVQTRAQAVVWCLAHGFEPPAQ